MTSCLPTFSDVINKISSKEHKHVLLGNGYSQACRSDIFSYGSLLENADFSQLSKTSKNAFEVLGTTDFEVVIKLLMDSSKIVNLYSPNQVDLINTLRDDSAKLKGLLVETIAKHHPSNPSVLSELEFKNGREFLRHFTNIYTLNYDLLMYWTLMHEFKNENPPKKLVFDDGFRAPSGNSDNANYVSWEIENSNRQNIYYLHGALHLFESESELTKFTWIRTGVTLMEQINEALEKQSYPLIVAEGTSIQKMKRIMKSGYLQRGLKSLASIGGNLFIYGMSMSQNDDHIIGRIKKSKVSKLWLSVYGNPKNVANKEMMSRAKALFENKEVNFYDASSAKIWGK